MRRIALAFAFALLVAPAAAQQIGPGHVMGNSTAAQRTPTDTALSALFDRAFTCSANGQILARAAGAWTCTATPTLGAAGTLGSITFGNATSGLLTLQPITGALGTITLSLPAVTDTLVAKTTTDTLTNKTLTSPTITNPTVTGSFTATGLVTLADHATQGANTFIANVTSGTATPTAASLPSCTGAASALQYTLGGGLSCATITASASSITAGTTVVNGGPGVLYNSSNGGTLISSTTLPSGLTAPSFTITTAFTATGLVTNAALANAAAYTFKGNATGSSAAPTDFTIAGLTHKAIPAGSDLLIISDQAASSATKYTTISEALAGAGSGTVTSVVCGTATITGTGTCTGNLLGFQTFVASGTYTRTAGTTKALVTCMGGGGGGGGVTSGTDASAAGGGGQGEWVQKLVTTIAADSPITVTAGTGGTAGTTSGTSGSAGGTTTFASATPVTAIGGGGGTGDTTGQGPRAGGAGGTGGTGVDVAIKGNPGGTGLGINTIAAIGLTLGMGGNGGGQGGGIGTNSATGVAGVRGGGGSGGSSAGAGSAAGGLGGVGWCTVQEFS